MRQSSKRRRRESTLGNGPETGAASSKYFPDEIKRREAGLVRECRNLAFSGDDRKRAASQPQVGLAPSGGGIRSATISLGLLQALASIGVLKRFDYLSTVSGGGYIGGFLGGLFSPAEQRQTTKRPPVEVPRQFTVSRAEGAWLSGASTGGRGGGEASSRQSPAEGQIVNDAARAMFWRTTVGSATTLPPPLLQQP